MSPNMKPMHQNETHVAHGNKDHTMRQYPYNGASISHEYNDFYTGDKLREQSDNCCWGNLDKILQKRYPKLCLGEKSLKSEACSLKEYLQKSLADERIRILTFVLYPRSAPCSSFLLASLGFVYVGDGSENDHTVACVFCCVVVKQPKDNGGLRKIHKSLSENCPMVLNRDCGNKPLVWGDLSSGFFHVNRDVNSASCLVPEILPNSAPPARNITENVPNSDPSARNITENGPNSVPPALNITENVPNSDPLARNITENVPNSNSSASTVNVSSNVAISSTAQYSSASPINNNSPSTSQIGDDGNNSTLTALQHDCVQFEPTMTTNNSFNSEHSQVNSSHVHTNLESPLPYVASASEHLSTDSQAAHVSESPRPQSQPGLSHQNQSPSPGPGPGQSPSPNSSQSQSQSQSRVTSYEELGIMTALPKKPEYAVEATRLRSYDAWPSDHHLNPSDLVKAGFFYSGYSDTARCFFCAGGIRNWEEGDDVWVEHARWFPKCPFIRQRLGSEFIKAVQDMNEDDQTMISYNDVITEMKKLGLESRIPRGIVENATELEQDAAVKAVISHGFAKEDTIKAAQTLRDNGEIMSAELIFDELYKQKVGRSAIPAKNVGASDNISDCEDATKHQATLESLRNENADLRQMTACKVCMDKEVSVVFLPCGHMVTCNDCSLALRSCPICRDDVKGVVRAFLS